MESKRCYGCDRPSHSLFTANCGHKTCFYCYKNTKPAHRCRKCNQKSSHSLSPLKNKSAEKPSHLMSQQTKHGNSYSPFMETDRNNNNNPPSNRTSKDCKPVGQSLICLQHKEPLNMFCKSTKQILCSGCLCKKSKYAQQIQPLRNAQQFLRKQNKIFRQQARVAQGDVDTAWRTVNKNRQIFQQSAETHSLIITSFFDNLISNLRQIQQNSIKVCRQYLHMKIAQYGSISDDLHYLSQTLKQYRQNSNDNNNINQLAYFYTSFNVIKKTLQTLSFDYIAYDKKQIALVDFDRELVNKVQRELVRFKLHLDIKSNEHRNNNNNKSRSSSIKSTKNKVSPDTKLLNSKHKISQQMLMMGGIKKHKFSLCSNASVQYQGAGGQGDQGNLYKRLLKTKYKL